MVLTSNLGGLKFYDQCILPPAEIGSYSGRRGYLPKILHPKKNYVRFVNKVQAVVNS